MPPIKYYRRYALKKTVKALINGIKTNTIDFVTSDHLPMNIEEKQVEFENAAYGSIGLESAFGSLLTLFDLEKTSGNY